MDMKTFFDALITSVPMAIFITIGGALPFIASILSILFIIVRFLGHVEKYHQKSFIVFFKWCFDWIKGNKKLEK